MNQATGLTAMPSPWTSKVAKEESCSSCSAKKRRKGDHHQPEQEQMSRMAAAGITGITEMQSAGEKIWCESVRGKLGLKNIA